MSLDLVPEALPAADARGDLVASASLEDKVRLLTGATAWSLHALPGLGLGELVVSDGPVGVRGRTDDPADTSLLFPAPSALAATWDARAATTLGRLFAQEAVRKGVHLVLAPVVNLQRTPVGGRHFECYSEDPALTGDIAVPLVAAMQAAGVGACVKHFVANDSETERTSYLATIDERTLREVYLSPFERLVTEATPWSVMAAYNGIDDGTQAASATEHRRLLSEVLKREWGYDGVVVSDWLANTSVAPSAMAGLDLVMPGPGGSWSEGLLDAVRDGTVPEAVVDDKVRRILRLAARAGVLEGGSDAAHRGVAGPAAPREPSEPSEPRESVQPVQPVDGRVLLRELAARSTVVLRDDGVLPLDLAPGARVALIGPNAVEPFVQGGGSAHVNPAHVVTPAEGLAAALPDSVTLTVHRGGRSTVNPPAVDLAGGSVHDPTSGRPGVRVDHLAPDGAVVASHVVASWPGRLSLIDEPDTAAVRLTARIRLDRPGRHTLSAGTVGAYEVRVDGELVDSGEVAAGPEVILDSSVNDPTGVPVVLAVSRPREVDLVVTSAVIEAGPYGRFVRVALRHDLPGASVEDEIADAVHAARLADVAVVVVGTNAESESEGWDRTTLALPGRQDALVRAVAAANPRTVVVVNAGAPVLLPWLDEDGVAAVLWTWLPGQEGGHALADVLVGATEPSGRLPWTLPAREQDVPVPHAVPVDGRVRYDDGVHIGHRAWDRDQLEPARPFGFGLGWTRWSYDTLVPLLDGADDGTDAVQLDVTIGNTGARSGREVVQVYLEPEVPDPLRPVRWLAAHEVVDVEPGRTVTARVTVPQRAFEVWDTDGHRWTVSDGSYRVRVGRSSRDLRLSSTIHAPRQREEAR